MTVPQHGWYCVWAGKSGMGNKHSGHSSRVGSWNNASSSAAADALRFPFALPFFFDFLPMMLCNYSVTISLQFNPIFDFYHGFWTRSWMKCMIDNNNMITYLSTNQDSWRFYQLRRCKWRSWRVSEYQRRKSIGTRYLPRSNQISFLMIYTFTIMFVMVGLIKGESKSSRVK